jgi:flagellar biosynthesis/type III secretory pathway chaperone
MEICEDLRQRLSLCQELLGIVEREQQALRRTDNPPVDDFFQSRKNLLPRLVQSLDTLRRHRLSWQQTAPEERSRHGDVSRLLRQNQDMTMKIILLDRENEQLLLRRGLVPARELPSANRQRPHFVADLYRRQSTS